MTSCQPNTHYVNIIDMFENLVTRLSSLTVKKHIYEKTVITNRKFDNIYRIYLLRHV